MFEKYPEIMSIKDMMCALSVGRSTAYKLIRSGKVDFFKIGDAIRVPRGALEKFVLAECPGLVYHSEAIANGQSVRAD